MVLFKISKGIITVISVVRETKCGWRQHGGGFINRSRLSENYPSISGYYYTTDIAEAKRWAKIQINLMSEILSVAKASLSDVTDWDDNGADENSLPKPRQ